LPSSSKPTGCFVDLLRLQQTVQNTQQQVLSHMMLGHPELQGTAVNTFV
jgi:hypothetical protein